MSVGRRTAIVGACVLLVILTAVGRAEELTDQAEHDEAVRIAPDDPLMEEAKRKGRATLTQFLGLVRAPEPTMAKFAVKVGLKAPHGLEFVWVRPFEQKDGRYVGALRNTPESLKPLKAGDTISFGEEDIVDWTYFDDGKMKGNFTACALLKRRPPEEMQAFKMAYGLVCEP
jgi:uncharacterized protein YegJ (DUF2314 family)